MQRARVSNGEEEWSRERPRSVKVQREVVELRKPYLPLEDAYSVLLQRQLYFMHISRVVERSPNCEKYPPEESTEDDRADPHMGAGWHTPVASTLPLVIFEPRILNRKQDLLLAFVLRPFSSLEVDSTFRSRSSGFKLELDSDWRLSGLTVLSRKRSRAWRDLKTSVQHRTFFYFFYFFWKTKRLCARGKSFRVHKGTEDGVDERRKVSGTINIALSGKVDSRPLS